MSTRFASDLEDTGPATKRSHPEDAWKCGACDSNGIRVSCNDCDFVACMCCMFFVPALRPKRRDTCLVCANVRVDREPSKGMTIHASPEKVARCITSTEVCEMCGDIFHGACADGHMAADGCVPFEEARPLETIRKRCRQFQKFMSPEDASVLEACVEKSAEKVVVASALKNIDRSAFLHQVRLLRRLGLEENSQNMMISCSIPNMVWPKDMAVIWYQTRAILKREEITRKMLWAILYTIRHIRSRYPQNPVTVETGLFDEFSEHIHETEMRLHEVAREVGSTLQEIVRERASHRWECAVARAERADDPDTCIDAFRAAARDNCPVGRWNGGRASVWLAATAEAARMLQETGRMDEAVLELERATAILAKDPDGLKYVLHDAVTDAGTRTLRGFATVFCALMSAGNHALAARIAQVIAPAVDDEYLAEPLGCPMTVVSQMQECLAN